MNLRRLLKILHEVGSAGMMGALAAHLVLIVAARDRGPAEYAAIRAGIDLMARWLLLPSTGLVVVSGLFGMGVHAPFHNAGWVWIKAALGMFVLEGTLGAVIGPAKRAAQLSQLALEGKGNPAEMADVLRHERGGLWLLLVLCALNIVLAVWRPRFRKSSG